MLPNGFSDLVAITIDNWNLDVLPEKDAEIWNALIYPVFLGGIIRSSQAIYVKDVLESHVAMGAAQTARTDPHWSEKVMNTINLELATIEGTQGEGLKRIILNAVAKDVQSLSLSRTIHTALSFFSKNNINAAEIRRIKNNIKRIDNLVVLAAKKIHNVGIVKAVLWLYDCGIGDNSVPPNYHVKRFLTECKYPGFGWSRNDEAEDWQIYKLAGNKMSEVAQQVSKELKQNISPKQAQTAVWYLQTCRGLLQGRRRKLTPRILIDFLQDQRWDIDELAERVLDVEKLGDLAEDLKNFLKIII